MANGKVTYRTLHKVGVQGGDLERSSEQFYFESIYKHIHFCTLAACRKCPGSDAPQSAGSRFDAIKLLFDMRQIVEAARGQLLGQHLLQLESIAAHWVEGGVVCYLLCQCRLDSSVALIASARDITESRQVCLTASNGKYEYKFVQNTENTRRPFELFKLEELIYEVRASTLEAVHNDRPHHHEVICQFTMHMRLIRLA